MVPLWIVEKMGVHAQGESGFFDEDSEVSLVHNDDAVHQQHEPAADDGTVGNQSINYINYINYINCCPLGI